MNTRAGKHWNYGEYRRTKNLRRSGISLEAIAKRQGRSVSAIEVKLKLRAKDGKPQQKEAHR